MPQQGDDGNTRTQGKDQPVLNIGNAFRRAVRAFVNSMGPGQYAAGNIQVICPHCGGNEFSEATAQLTTAGMTFLACTNCGCIQWFIKSPTRM
jgi:hypothetical protein